MFKLLTLTFLLMSCQTLVGKDQSKPNFEKMTENLAKGLEQYTENKADLKTVLCIRDIFKKEILPYCPIPEDIPFNKAADVFIFCASRLDPMGLLPEKMILNCYLPTI